MNFKSLIKIISIILLIAMPILAEIRLDQPVKSIVIVDEEGTKNIEIQLETKIGYNIDEDDLRGDINKLMLIGIYKKITPKTYDDDRGINLVFESKLYPEIKRIDLEGNTVFKNQEILKLIKNKKGKRLNIKYLKDDLANITHFYKSKGYDLFQIISSEIEGNTLKIKLSEGQIEEIKWQGLKNIKQKLLLRKIASRPNKVFNSLYLRNDRDLLIQTGYFREVSAPLLQENTTRNSVVITFQVAERKANRLDTGLELDLRDSILVSFFRGNINHILKHGDSLVGSIQFDLEKAEISVRNHSIRYTTPWDIKGHPIDISVGGWLRQERERISDSANDNLFDIKRYGAELSITTPIIQNRCIYTSAIKVEKIENQDTRLIAFDPYSVQSLSQTISYFKLDNQFNPRRGVYWTLNLERGWDMGIIQTPGVAFTRGGANLAGFTPLTKKIVGAARVFTGIFSPDNGQQQTFEQEIYEMGGPNTLRGYRINRAFIGFRELLFNFELRRDILENKQLVFFIDTGKIFDTGFDLKTQDFHTGYGVGIRFFTPIGPLRFDLARGEQDTILHFSLGQLF